MGTSSNRCQPERAPFANPFVISPCPHQCATRRLSWGRQVRLREGGNRFWGGIPTGRATSTRVGCSRGAPSSSWYSR